MADTSRLTRCEALRLSLWLLHHCDRAIENRSPRWLTLAVEGPLSVLTAGHLAVILFFVLSGFVLALPYRNGTNQSYLIYAVRRLIRLCLPMLFATGFAAVLFIASGAGHPLPGLSNVMLQSWYLPVSAETLGRHLMLLGYPKSSVSLDLPLWSLIVELRVSLVFPVLAGTVRRYGWRSVPAAIITMLICGKINSLNGQLSPYTAETLFGSLVLTSRYVVFFILGINIACYLPQLESWLIRIRPTGHVIICAAIAVANAVMVDLRIDQHGYAMLLDGMFGCYIILCCITFSAPAKLLDLPVCVWLGRISFSLYLVHVPILLAMFYLMPANMAPAWAVAATVPVMFIVSDVMQRTIEGPAIELSRRVGRYMTRTIDPDRIAA